MKIQLQNLDTNNSINLSSNIGNQKIVNEEICNFDLSNLRSCTPAGVLLASSIIKKFQKKNPKLKIEFNIDKENQQIAHASNMRFFSTIESDSELDKGIVLDKSEDLFMPITKFHFHDYMKSWMYSHMTPEQYIEYEAITFAKHLSQDENVINILAFCINEVVKNALQHAGVDYVWISAQNFKNQNKIEFAVLDEGIGCKKRLEKIFNTRLYYDEKALKMAIRPIVAEIHSTDINDEENQIGMGLYLTSEICNSLNGNFTILSGDTAVTKGAGSTTVKSGYHKGTFVKFSINTSEKFDYKDILNKAFDKADLIVKHKLETLM